MAATAEEEGGSTREVLRGLFFLRRHGGWQKKCNNVKIRRDDCLYGKNAKLTMIEVRKEAQYHVK